MFQASSTFVADCSHRIEVTIAPVLFSPEVLAAHDTARDEVLDAATYRVARYADAAHVALNRISTELNDDLIE